LAQTFYLFPIYKESNINISTEEMSDSLTNFSLDDIPYVKSNASTPKDEANRLKSLVPSE